MIEQDQTGERHGTKAVSRRNFLAMASTSAALSASYLKGAQGKSRSFCVDCQSHLYAPEMVAFMKTRKSPPYGYEKDGDTYVVVGKWHRRLRENHMSPKAKVAAMDAAGIDVTVLSINDPGPERFGKDGIRAARLANDFVASVVREHPGRFCGLAFLPLQDMQAAQIELGRCAEKLGVKGIYLCSNINGEFSDEPKYRKLFKWAEQLELPVVMHPAYPVTYEQTKEYQLTAGLGLMFDTSIALARIIMAGILEQHPGLKLICPHVGGTLPYLIGRLDHQTRVLKRGLDNIKKLPSEYLKQVHFDTVSPIALAIKYCYDLVGADHLLYASDHPWVQPNVIAGHIKQLHLPAEDERKVFGENARRLFKL
ncbi:MAG: amidohydrolase family protein [Planctomycetota bacterium]|jgi:predicted TIM-barrel fold metal-dependent hydrolase